MTNGLAKTQNTRQARGWPLANQQFGRAKTMLGFVLVSQVEPASWALWGVFPAPTALQRKSIIYFNEGSKLGEEKARH